MEQQLLAWLYPIGGFVVALGILVFMHELGHYTVARLCGIKVLRFSLGFGPVLKSWRSAPDATEWTLSAVPLGGYVRMVDEREGEVAAADLPFAFNRQSLGRRAAVVAAGPLTNLALAVLLFALVAMLGMPGWRPYLDAPPAGSVVAAAGVRIGDLPLSLAGQPVPDRASMAMELATHAAAGHPFELLVQDPDGQQRTLIIPAAQAFSGADGDPAKALGFKFLDPARPAVIGGLTSDGVAREQGLRVGDTILTVDAHPVADWLEFVRLVRAAPGRTLALTLRRDQRVLSLALTPRSQVEAGKTVGKIGAEEPPVTDPRYLVEVRHGPWSALQLGARRTWDLSVMTVTMLGRMITGQVSSRGIGGPLQIASAAGDAARMGLVPFLGLLGLVSVSLGVLNLLPVPVLDGGHLLYYSFELFSGRPLPERLIAAGTQVGIVLLVGLMALAFYNDFNRFFPG
jgi:regulator of sigma E protease